MAKATVARCEAQHLPQVFELYQRTFGGNGRRNFERRYRWSRLENLAPADTFEWVLLAEDGRVVGCLAALPVPYAVGGQRLWAHTTADFMVDPAYSFHGLSLMRECFKRCPRQVSLDDVAATKAVLGYFKARAVLTLARHAKPLDGRVLQGRPGWVGKVPPVLLAPAGPALRALDRVRRPGGLEAAVPVPFDGRFDAFAAAGAARGGASVYRDQAYYRWRYGPGSPQAGAQALALLDGSGAPRAYAVVATGTGDVPQGHLLELVSDGPLAKEGWLALLVAAVGALRTQGASAAYAHLSEASPPELLAAMGALGFTARAYRTTLFTRPSPADDPALGALLHDATRWDFQYGDAEVTHSVVV